MRDCVGVIEVVQHIDGPLQFKYWGGVHSPDPCGVDANAPLSFISVSRRHRADTVGTDSVG